MEHYITFKSLVAEHGKETAEKLRETKRLKQQLEGDAYPDCPHHMNHPDFGDDEDSQLHPNPVEPGVSCVLFFCSRPWSPKMHAGWPGPSPSPNFFVLRCWNLLSGSSCSKDWLWLLCSETFSPDNHRSRHPWDVKLVRARTTVNDGHVYSIHGLLALGAAAAVSAAFSQIIMSITAIVGDSLRRPAMSFT